MGTLTNKLNQISARKGIKGNFDARLAIAARALLANDNTVKIDPDDLPTTLANLIASAGAGAALASAVTGSDLTASGTLTTLATNIGNNTTQGAALRDALNALTTNSALSSKLSVKVIAAPVAAAGSSVSDAAALGSANLLAISSDSAAKGVKLVAGVAGDLVDIINTSATAAILYPATGGTINGLAANAGVVIPASKGVRLFCTATNTWFANDMTARATAA